MNAPQKACCFNILHCIIIYFIKYYNNEIEIPNIKFKNHTLRVLNKDEDHEFLRLFEEIFELLKHHFRNKPEEKDETQVEALISHLRTLYNNLSRSEFAKAAALVLNLLFALYFRISQFEQCMFLFKVIRNDVDL